MNYPVLAGPFIPSTPDRLNINGSAGEVNHRQRFLGKTAEYIIMWRPLIAIVAFMIASMGVSLHAALIPVIIPPVSTPCLNYSISLNLTYASLPNAVLSKLNELNPVLYRSIELVARTVPPWFGLGSENLSLIVYGESIHITNWAVSNSTGGIEWHACIGRDELNAVGPWTVVIGSGDRYPLSVLFGFRTGNESLRSLLGNLSRVGGVLLGENNHTYNLWHRVGNHYGVPMPMHVVLYAWLGSDLSPRRPVSPLPTYFDGAPFPYYGKYIDLRLFSVVNGSVESSASYGVNLTVGSMTGFGLSIYGTQRLLPYGPLQYNSMLFIYGNGTIASASCLGESFYDTEVTLQFINPAYGNYITMPIYNYRSPPTGIALINGSLISGGYLTEYDFYNDSSIVEAPLFNASTSACKLN